jgi:hypothetical protein
MSTIGSGERIVVLSDKTSTSTPATNAGADIPTPPVGRLVIFLHTDGVGGSPTGAYSKDSDGLVIALGGGASYEPGWRALTTGNPTLAGNITHTGGAAVGVAPGLGETLPANTVFRVDGGTAQNGPVFFQEIAAALADLTGRTQVFRVPNDPNDPPATDGGLYSKPDGLSERRMDAPGLTRKALEPGETIIVPNGYQYVAYGTFNLNGGRLSLEGDADLVVI